MKTVLVTGAEGFIGKNLCSSLSLLPETEVLKYDLGNTPEQLRGYIDRCDIIYRLAGINRPKTEEEFYTGNTGFTENVLSVIEKSGRKIPVVFTSSIQALRDNAYGKSKKAAETAIFEWSRRNGVSAYVYRLPNVFGKWCRPGYNSVTATFCHNIARGLPIQINDPAAGLSLVYIDDVVSDFLHVLSGEKSAAEDGFCYVSRTFQTTVGKLAEQIRSFSRNRDTLVMPEFSGEFERFLYATYVSYLPEREFSYKLDKKEDNRGWLAVFIKSGGFGQIFISKTKPGVTRGNHWHNTKVEKFLVIQGEACIRFRKIGSDEVLEYRVSGNKPEVVDIPTGYTHSIENVGRDEMITLFWSDQIFDPSKPDTFYLSV